VKGYEGDGVIEKEALYTFLGKLIDYGKLLKRLERRGFRKGLVELLVKQHVDNRAFLQDEEAMTLLGRHLRSEGYEVGELLRDEEHNTHEMVASTTGKDPVRGKIGWELISSADFQGVILLWGDISSLDRPPFEVYRDGRDAVAVSDKEGLVSYLLEEAKKGLSIQRYKGLGEMNPDQLWETTMDPEKRTLLKVKIEDMFEAHDIFTVLMGGEVDQRREFIERNALEVRSLDI
jgi:DNA gyrase subunit B